MGEAGRKAGARRLRPGQGPEPGRPGFWNYGARDVCPPGCRRRGPAGRPQNRERAHIAYTGGIMPPPDAVAGKYVGPDSKKIKVAPLTDEDKRTLARWIDLGCPIDLTEKGSQGWLLDDQRPTLTLTYPQA